MTMLRLVVLVSVVWALNLSATSAIQPFLPAPPPPPRPMDDGHKTTSRIVKRDVGVADGVLWTAQCSPRVVGLIRGQNQQLSCECYAPSDAAISWFKEGAQLYPQTDVEVREEHTNQLTTNTENADATSDENHTSSILRLVTKIFLDCVADQDQGTYRLEVTDPNTGATYIRRFTTVIFEAEGEAGQCGGVVSAVPRIYQYAPEVVTSVGSFVTLPCRHLGGHYVTSVWYLNHVAITNGTNNWVQASGDLRTHVHHVGRSLYTCRVTSQLYPGLVDYVHTLVFTN